MRRKVFSPPPSARAPAFSISRTILRKVLVVERKLMLSPSAGYMHKTGFGVSATGYAVAEQKLNFYQAALTPSYDFIRRGKFSTGIAFTKYFTKEDLSFYTTPICNEISAYFTYRNFFVQPAVSLAYGWGSRTDYEEHKVEVFLLRRFRDRNVIIIENEESCSRSVAACIPAARLQLQKRVPLWRPVLYYAGRSYFGRLPKTSDSIRRSQATLKRLNNFLPGNQYIKEKTSFDSQSASFVLRADYSLNRFFFQSQFLLRLLSPHCRQKTQQRIRGYCRR